MRRNTSKHRPSGWRVARTVRSMTSPRKSPRSDGAIQGRNRTSQGWSIQRIMASAWGKNRSAISPLTLSLRHESQLARQFKLADELHSPLLLVSGGLAVILAIESGGRRGGALVGAPRAHPRTTTARPRAVPGSQRLRPRNGAQGFWRLCAGSNVLVEETVGGVPHFG